MDSVCGGLPRDGERGQALFIPVASATGMTIWSAFKRDTKYLEPGTASFMINFRVADLHALLTALKAEGCNVEDRTEESEQGKFGWVIDPEGNKVELWEPPAGQ